MSTTTTTCVSLATGALGPDLRVNYEYGLVLGVEEFRQEQFYFLEKDALYNRGLHGYGTVSGLRVRTERSEDNPAKEVLITVEPGLGIDQWGRPIVVRGAQCARLGAWLAKEVQAHEGILAEHVVDERYTVYVVARYDFCPDELVPIAGQPCSSADEAQAASRLRDAPNIELRWQPPAMVAWDAVRRFALLLDRVNIAPGAINDEAELTAWVRSLHKVDLNRPLDVLGPNNDVLTTNRHFTLPAETANAALDRIFTVWVTEVRPLVEEHLLEPSAAHEGKGAEAGVLLARIDFALSDPFVPADPEITEVYGPKPDEESIGQPIDDGRPYLLHTQLIQELLLLDDAATAAAKPVREFATLQIVPGQGLLVWVHHIDVLSIPPEALELRVNGTVVTTPLSVTPIPPTPNLFQVATTEAIPLGARVELWFRLDRVLGSGSIPLSQTIDSLPHAYLGHLGSAIVAFATEDEVEVGEGVSLTREFVTITTVNDRTVRLWFHTDNPDDSPLPLILPDSLDVVRWSNGASTDLSFNCAVIPTGAPSSVFWDLVLSGDETLVEDDFLFIRFDGSRIIAQTPSGDPLLSDLLPTESPPFLGYDGAKTIDAYHAVDLTPQVTEQPEARVLPVLPFVTITPRWIPGENEPLEFEVWFHLDKVPSVDQARIHDPNFEIFVEIEFATTPMAIPFTGPTSVQHNVFRATIKAETIEATGDSKYYRFVFPSDSNIVSDVPNGGTLRQYMANNLMLFEGFRPDAAAGDNGTIVAYVRVPDRD